MVKLENAPLTKLVNVTDLKSVALNGLPVQVRQGVPKSNVTKNKLLGMPHGTALGKLKKSLMFYMAIRLNMDTCYRCSKLIESIKDFSIEHKENWQSATNPAAAFFNLDNIAFSHLSCNVIESNRNRKFKNKKEREKARYVRRKNDVVKYEARLAAKKEVYHENKRIVTVVGTKLP